jgi:alpha-D-ribose 1-methylphosphonate 5-triphosphate synthase subunit PhnG
MMHDSLTMVLGRTEAARLREIVEQIAAISRIQLLKPAGTSLLMMGVRESVQLTPFYLGEVLISQCVVTVDGITGYGFAMGEDLERAYQLGVLAAALRGRHELADKVEALIVEQTARLQQEECREYAAVLQTKVRFEPVEENVNATDN